MKPLSLFYFLNAINETRTVESPSSGGGFCRRRHLRLFLPCFPFVLIHLVFVLGRDARRFWVCWDCLGGSFVVHRRRIPAFNGEVARLLAGRWWWESAFRTDIWPDPIFQFWDLRWNRHGDGALTGLDISFTSDLSYLAAGGWWRSGVLQWQKASRSCNWVVPAMLLELWSVF